MDKKIFVMGGGGFAMEADNLLLDKYLLSLSRKKRPKVCFIPTASGDSDDYIKRFFHAYEKLNCTPSYLSLFKPHTDNLEAFILEQDIIHVGGGNTLNLLCLWKQWGLDSILEKALNKGIVLSGMSAGMICWFEQGLTDSKGIGLEVLDCLGFLKNSACPHFDGEKERAPTYTKMIKDKKILPGLALDDGCGALYINDALKDIVSSRENVKGHIFNEKGDFEILSPRFLD